MIKMLPTMNPWMLDVSAVYLFVEISIIPSKQCNIKCDDSIKVCKKRICINLNKM